MKNAAIRTIYNNYDIYETYPDDYIIECALSCEWVNPEDITDSLINTLRDEQITEDYNMIIGELLNFFTNVDKVVTIGEAGFWYGRRAACVIGDFETVFYKIVADCDYINIFDKNGHLYIEASHHDGTHVFEIKTVTAAGVNYYDNWNYNWNNSKSECQIIQRIFNNYSRLPHVYHELYGGKKIEYV